MAIADKLTELQATKTAIKTAIENKGQDLSSVPFTDYADKIRAIQSGGSGLQGVGIEITSNITNALLLSNTLFANIQSSHIACAVLTKAKNNAIVNNQVIFAFCLVGGNAYTQYGLRVRNGAYTSITFTDQYDVGVTIGDIYTVYDLGEVYGN